MQAERLIEGSTSISVSPLRIGCYPTAKSLPLLAGIKAGIFARYGVAPTLHFHDNSRRQRDGLANGEFNIVHMAVDNAVSMIEDDGRDVVVVVGGDSGMNEFFVQPEIESLEQLRGKRIVVDAVDTAYALQAIKILDERGLSAGRDYELDPVGRGELRLAVMKRDKSAAGAILNPPYSMQAEDAGFRSLGATASMLGGYQASGGFALRAWAEANRALLTQYLAAYVASLRLIRERTQRETCEQILRDELGLAPDIARRSLDQLLDPVSGFARDAEFDPAGFANVLAMRRMTKGGTASSDNNSKTTDMVDLSFYDSARTLLDRQGAAS